MIIREDGDPGPDLHQIKEEEIMIEIEMIEIVIRGIIAIGDQAEAILRIGMIITLRKKPKKSSKD